MNYKTLLYNPPEIIPETLCWRSASLYEYLKVRAFNHNVNNKLNYRRQLTASLGQCLRTILQNLLN